ncbi:SDR family NAD(P)-dependent oxidoreductase [Candidatus Uhrbacteria bacterium]|nr:SDR family NAD(P)-dependent oxidoreductase [Candidatus Uhrbacteria bacterium]
MNILVTGGAGFIGSHTAKELCRRGHHVVIVDDFNDYYDPQLKEDRVQVLLKGLDIPVHRIDIRDYSALERVFGQYHFDAVCHLAARAGVRASLEHPRLYQEVNVGGTTNMLELSVRSGVGRFVFASSSSVYGNNKKLPFSEDDPVDHPISPYAATKKACELMAYSYHHLYHLPVVGLRYFTVYGPWGRPDMALFKFTRAIVEGTPIEVYNKGDMRRDFTYIDDIVLGTVAATELSDREYHVLNLGNNHTEQLTEFITIIENEVGKTAKKIYKDIQPGDVPATSADITKARELLGFGPKTRIQEGIPRFIEWYQSSYQAALSN